MPTDSDAQPPVQAAAALRSVIRSYREDIEREQRLPKALVEQFHAAGFYSLVIPRDLGGLQADPLTYLRVVELLAEGAGSVGWRSGLTHEPKRKRAHLQEWGNIDRQLVHGGVHHDELVGPVGAAPLRIDRGIDRGRCDEDVVP